MYNPSMEYGYSVIKHLNSFNTKVSQLLFIDINIYDVHKYINLLCSLPDSWVSLVVAIGSNENTLSSDDVV